jgi:membrane dipeptidase
VGVAGADHVGFGSDFDGAFMPEGMEDASKFPFITEGLLRRGYGEADIRKILGENTLRVLGDAERIGKSIKSEKP